MPGGYHFNFHRDLGDVRLIVIDTPQRPRARARAGGRWSTTASGGGSPITPPTRAAHLLIASSVPVLVPGGLHDLQQWNEAICAGRWGRPVAVDRRAHPARPRPRGLGRLRPLVPSDVRIARRHADGTTPPATITLLSGDIHFAYVASVELPDTDVRLPRRARW